MNNWYPGTVAPPTEGDYLVHTRHTTDCCAEVNEWSVERYTGKTRGWEEVIHEVVEWSSIERPLWYA